MFSGYFRCERRKPRGWVYIAVDTAVGILHLFDLFDLFDLFGLFGLFGLFLIYLILFNYIVVR